MNNTIVGVYESRDKAEAVRDDLVRSGLDESDISITAEPPSASRGAGRESFWDKVKEFFGGEDTSHYAEATRRGGVVVTVDTDEDRIDLVSEIVERYDPIDIETQVQEWRQQGWTPPTQLEAQEEVRGEAGDVEERIPLAEERLRVGKRREQRGGVRVYTRVTETPVEEQIDLTDERVHVERRPVDRPAGDEAFRERTIEAVESHEELVVSKEARVTEEVVVRKTAERRSETVRDTVRKTEVDVEELGEIRRDFQSSYPGKRYEDYEPAFQFGRDLAMNDQYRGREWNAIEADARRSFDERYPGGWNRYKGAVRDAFQRFRTPGQRADDTL